MQTTYFSLDHWVVYIFLSITLLVGIWVGRDVKDLREYAIANRIYGTGVLTITFLATSIGGSTIIGTTGNVFRDGILAILSTDVAPVICILWMAFWIAPRMIHFEGCLTMGDIMKIFYGKQGQIATGVMGFFAAICIVSGQIQALAYVYEYILNVKSQWAIALGGLTTITYSALGGMKSVTITDVLQFVVMVIVIPMIAHVVTNEVGGIKVLFSQISTTQLQFIDHPNLGYYVSVMLFICIFNPFFFTPPFISRLLMARDKLQAKNMLLVGSAFCVCFAFLIMLIDLSASVLYPTLATDKIFPHILHEFFPVGLRGLCAAGIIAVLMSTADSFLHATGLSIVHDIISPLFTRKFQELKWVRYCTFGMGCAAILLTLQPHSVFGIVIHGIGIMGATITVPFITGVLGFKVAPRAFQIALWGTIPVFIATHMWFDSTIAHWAYPVSLIVNVILFFGVHLGQRGHLTGDIRPSHSKRLPNSSGFRLTAWLPTPRKLMEYANQKLDRYGYDATLFALFLSINYMVPFFMYSDASPATYYWVLAIRAFSILLCIGLLLKPYWPTKLLNYFPLYYYLTLLYCLPFATTFLFLVEGGNIEWVVNVALSILFLIVLVDWTTFLGLSLLGSLLAVGVYKLGISSLPIHMDWNTQYTLMYAVIFSTLIGLLFARRQTQRFDRLTIKNQYLTLKENATSGFLCRETRTSTLKSGE